MCLCTCTHTSASLFEAPEEKLKVVMGVEGAGIMKKEKKNVTRQFKEWNVILYIMW